MEPGKNSQTQPTEPQEPKKFLNRFEIIDAIKELDDSIINVSLNLIKCDFKATEDDVRNAFPDFKFLKVKNYHAGSFEIVLPLRIDAINFVKNSKDVYVLSRKPIIKMGRNFPVNDNDWTFVEGNPHGRHHGGRKHFNEHRKNTRPSGEHKEQGEREPGERRPIKKESEEVSTTPVQEKKQQVPKVVEVPKEPKVEPVKKVEAPKPPVQQKPPVPTDYKPVGFTSRKPGETKPAQTEVKVEPVKQPEPKIQKKPEPKPEPPVVQKKAEPAKQPEVKPVEVKTASKPEPKQQPKVQAKKVEQVKKPEPEKKQQDEWIFVVDKKGKKKK